MNGVLATILAILIYPGILAALVATWVLAWVRDAARAAVAGAAPTNPLADLASLRATLSRESAPTAAAGAPGVALAAILGVAAPLAALVLLPVPGNPIARPLGLTGDLAVEGALLLGLPLARLLAGWAMPSPDARQAADHGARLVAGYALPMILALMALSQQVVSLNLTVADAHSNTPLSVFALLARLLAAAAFACCLPPLARATVLRTSPGAAGDADGDLSELGGFDQVVFRIAEGLQLVAAAAIFVAAFILPLAVTAAPGLRAALWPVVMLLVAAGIGVWEALRAQPRKQSLPSAQGEPAAQTAQSDNPPLSWWFGFPLLLALIALVLAAWAARGA